MPLPGRAGLLSSSHVRPHRAWSTPAVYLFSARHIGHNMHNLLHSQGKQSQNDEFLTKRDECSEDSKDEKAKSRR